VLREAIATTFAHRNTPRRCKPLRTRGARCTRRSPAKMSSPGRPSATWCPRHEPF
jgi:hypothetical protein